MPATLSYLENFISGDTEAVRLDTQSSFYITDLNMNLDEWDSYSVGDMIDLDNDGTTELILNGPYDGMYLDVLDDQVVVFAEGEGTAMELSYVYYDEACLIVISDTAHAGRILHLFTRYSGSDTVVDSFELKAEFWNQDGNDENSKFTYRGETISMEQYEEIYADIFGR